MKCHCPKSWLTFFKAVHNEQRQEILHIIHKAKTINASDILKNIKLSQPTLSHHLSILVDAKIIDAEKKGKEVIYKVNQDFISHCCLGFVKKFKQN
jgi:ArsR family transcriptional regulator, arsenate/arsenite/antimonite-responsive transcriptional repressor